MSKISSSELTILQTKITNLEQANIKFLKSLDSQSNQPKKLSILVQNQNLELENIKSENVHLIKYHF
jgi:hypothetical protein